MDMDWPDGGSYHLGTVITYTCTFNTITMVDNLTRKNELSCCLVTLNLAFLKLISRRSIGGMRLEKWDRRLSLVSG